MAVWYEHAECSAEYCNSHECHLSHRSGWCIDGSGCYATKQEAEEIERQRGMKGQGND